MYLTFTLKHMLYLTRKINSGIVINNEITVKIIEIKRNNVKLGIDSPQSSIILKNEIHENIAKINLESMLSFDSSAT